MSSDQRPNLLRLMKLDDYLTWVNERLEVNTAEYNSNQNGASRRRISECIKMREDFQSQYDSMLIAMSTADAGKAYIGQSKL